MKKVSVVVIDRAIGSIEGDETGLKKDCSANFSCDIAELNFMTWGMILTKAECLVRAERVTFIASQNSQPYLLLRGARALLENR